MDDVVARPAEDEINSVSPPQNIHVLVAEQEIFA